MRQDDQTRIFLPGFGARAHSYSAGLPAGWVSLQPPPASATGGELEALADWLAGKLARRPGPAILAGHSMGAALAIIAAARNPTCVAGLILIAPAGLPLTKPLRASAADFVRQLGSGTHRVRDAAAAAAEAAVAPRSTGRLVRALRHLDLTDEMTRIRQNATPVTVVGCDSDTLTTPGHCRRAAELLGGRYDELHLGGGHIWMFGRWRSLARALDNAAPSRYDPEGA